MIRTQNQQQSAFSGVLGQLVVQAAKEAEQSEEEGAGGGAGGGGEAGQERQDRRKRTHLLHFNLNKHFSALVRAATLLSVQPEMFGFMKSV